MKDFLTFKEEYEAIEYALPHETKPYEMILRKIEESHKTLPHYKMELTPRKRSKSTVSPKVP